MVISLSAELLFLSVKEWIVPDAVSQRILQLIYLRSNDPRSCTTDPSIFLTIDIRASMPILITVWDEDRHLRSEEITLTWKRVTPTMLSGKIFLKM